MCPGRSPPPADDAGGAETRDGAVWHPGVEAVVAPSMDVDIVETQEDDLKELFNVMTRDAVDQVRDHDREILSVIKVMGGNVGQYKRERKAAMRAIVSEIYSPPRVTAAAKLLPELKLIPGFALDLTVADTDGRLWDFDDVVMRDRVRKRLLDERPMLLVGSPMCTAFSTWQRINNKIRDPVTVAGSSGERSSAWNSALSCTGSKPRAVGTLCMSTRPTPLRGKLRSWSAS